MNQELTDAIAWAERLVDGNGETHVSKHLRTLIAAAQPAQTEPVAWIAREPTPEMYSAMNKAMTDAGEDLNTATMWYAGWDAAPAAQPMQIPFKQCNPLCTTPTGCQQHGCLFESMRQADAAPPAAQIPRELTTREMIVAAQIPKHYTTVDELIASMPPEDIAEARRRLGFAHAALPEPINNDDLKSEVFQALGEASMAWNPRPSTEVFDSTLALEIGERLWSKIRTRLSSPSSTAQPSGECDGCGEVRTLMYCKVCFDQPLAQPSVPSVEHTSALMTVRAAAHAFANSGHGGQARSLYDAADTLAASPLTTAPSSAEALQLAARAFLVKYDKLEPALDNAFFMEANRGRPYKDETWEKELADLRLAAAEPSSSEPGACSESSQ